MKKKEFEVGKVYEISMALRDDIRRRRLFRDRVRCCHVEDGAGFARYNAEGDMAAFGLEHELRAGYIRCMSS